MASFELFQVVVPDGHVVHEFLILVLGLFGFRRMQVAELLLGREQSPPFVIFESNLK